MKYVVDVSPFLRLLTLFQLVIVLNFPSTHDEIHLDYSQFQWPQTNGKGYQDGSHVRNMDVRLGADFHIEVTGLINFD